MEIRVCVQRVHRCCGRQFRIDWWPQIALPDRNKTAAACSCQSCFISHSLSLPLFLSISLSFSRFCFVKFMPETRSTRATLTNCIKKGRDELKIRAMNSLCQSVKRGRERERDRTREKGSERELPIGRDVWAFSPLNIVLFCCCLLLVLVCFVCFSLVVVVCFVAVVVVDSCFRLHIFRRSPRELRWP